MWPVSGETDVQRQLIDSPARWQRPVEPGGDLQAHFAGSERPAQHRRRTAGAVDRLDHVGAQPLAVRHAHPQRLANRGVADVQRLQVDPQQGVFQALDAHQQGAGTDVFARIDQYLGNASALRGVDRQRSQAGFQPLLFSLLLHDIALNAQRRLIGQLLTALERQQIRPETVELGLRRQYLARRHRPSGNQTFKHAHPFLRPADASLEQLPFVATQFVVARRAGLGRHGRQLR
ncbi:hypothetical protein D3C73_1074330 [compost metagenome]